MRHTASWWTFVACVAAELVLATAATQCSSCSSPNLGWAGIAGYGALLALCLAGARSVAFWGALAATGAHVALVATLLSSGRLCAVCFVAAAVAVIMALAAFKAEPDNLARAPRALAVGAVGAQLVLVGAWIAQTHAVNAVAETAARSERVRIVAYERPDCSYCDEFERDILPAVRREFDVDVERRDASDRPELPTPTIVVSGPRGREVFPGLPTVSMLADAVRVVRGDHDEKTVLSRSR